MKHLRLALGTILAVLLLATAGWASWRYSCEQKFKGYIHEAKESLTKSAPDVALQFAAKIPEGSQEFEEAQGIEVSALREIAQDTDRIADQAENIINQVAQLKIEEEGVARDLAIANPGSQRALKLKKDVEQLQDLEHKLIQSNQYTAAGFGSVTDKGREEALAIVYQKGVGRPMDTKARALAQEIVAERSLVRAAAKRRDQAASFHANSVSKGLSDSFSTEGEFDTVLVIMSYDFTDADTLRRMTRVYQSKDVAPVLCDEGFTSVELRVPGISKAIIQIPLACPSK
jgi:hypothetical protein